MILLIIIILTVPWSYLADQNSAVKIPHHLRHSEPRKHHILRFGNDLIDRHGPNFDNRDRNMTTIELKIGDEAHLNCRISLLQDKIVAWIKRKTDLPPELLTFGPQVYSSDKRLKIKKEYPNNWRLRIDGVTKNDEGVYECQISTYPPKNRMVYLRVANPNVRIFNQYMLPVENSHTRMGDSVTLICRVRDLELPTKLRWLYNGRPIHHRIVNGGLSIKTDWYTYGADSILKLSRATNHDEGNYTCVAHGVDPQTVSVHIFAEKLAEFYSLNKSCPKIFSKTFLFAILMIYR